MCVCVYRPGVSARARVAQAQLRVGVLPQHRHPEPRARRLSVRQRRDGQVPAVVKAKLVKPGACRVCVGTTVKCGTQR